MPLKTPEPNVGQAAKNAKKRTIFLANNLSNEKENVNTRKQNLDLPLIAHPLDDQITNSLFQYTPSNYYDASGGGGTGATTRFYRDLQGLHKVENKIFHDEDSIDEEEEESEVVDEDRPLQILTTHNNHKNSIKESQMISSCQDYNFLAHL